MSVSLSLYIVLHFFVDLLCQINLPLEKNVCVAHRVNRRQRKKNGSDCNLGNLITSDLIL